MMTEGFVLAMLGIMEAILTSVVTFLLTRRKYRVEVHGGEIENSGHQIDNEQNKLDFYIKLVSDNKQKLDELSDENKDLRKQVAEMRSVVFGMLGQICTDMICQSRKFDQEQCPYYEQLFKLNRDGAETE